MYSLLVLQITFFTDTRFQAAFLIFGYDIQIILDEIQIR